ncbi:hypothetical protein ZIOFF_003188 [Zingiber officinale]|uniref:SAWADEE domain-containing protein n=1 Tax=Zingiber officinale TaxID=94328 RepID=A0A8J5IMR9_ZINOF|nr:hypothetical protein ZIOFF_003188 [Zingiber officinale]
MGRTLRSSLKPKAQSPSVSRSSEQVPVFCSLAWRPTLSLSLLGVADNSIMRADYVIEDLGKWFCQLNGVVQPTKPSKQKSEAEVGSSHAVSENVVVVSENVVADSSLSDAPGTSGLPKESEEKTADVAELEFEAKSLRDEACVWSEVVTESSKWCQNSFQPHPLIPEALVISTSDITAELRYDVAMFLAHRVINSGELEVRVRFQGFGAEEDEWVNVKNAVRERSIPLEASDCRKVGVGDLVLCFQENGDQAMYFDAHIVEIERKLHDIRGCRCLFSVRYDHDQTEVTCILYFLPHCNHLRKFMRKGCAAGRHIDCFSTDVSMVLGLLAIETMIFFEPQGLVNCDFAIGFFILVILLARFIAILGALIRKTSCGSCVAVAIVVIFEVDFSISEEILQIISNIFTRENNMEMNNLRDWMSKNDSNR